MPQLTEQQNPDSVQCDSLLMIITRRDATSTLQYLYCKYQFELCKRLIQISPLTYRCFWLTKHLSSTLLNNTNVISLLTSHFIFLLAPENHLPGVSAAYSHRNFHDDQTILLEASSQVHDERPTRLIIAWVIM